MKKLMTICAVVGLMVFTTSVVYALPSDNFNDNSMDTSLWSLLEQDHDNAWLDETNLRLELHSTTDAESVTAVYFANGWAFLPTNDFSFKIDFHFSSTNGSPLSDADISLGLASVYGNTDIEAGCRIKTNGVASPYFYHYLDINRLDGSYDDTEKVGRTTNDGILYISYNASEDELYLSNTGYWAVNAWITIPDLIQNQWGGAVVAPYIGGWTDSMALDSDEAYLDNFVVESGTLVPEPTTICLLGLGALLIRRKRGV